MEWRLGRLAVASLSPAAASRMPGGVPHLLALSPSFERLAGVYTEQQAAGWRPVVNGC